jgi:hypothetical protein
MSPTKHTAATGSSMENPYTCAYQRDLGTAGISDEGDRHRRSMDTVSHGYPVVPVRHLTPRQQQKLHRARLYASAQNLERLRQFGVGSMDFLLQATPTVGQLLEYTVSSNNCPCAMARSTLAQATWPRWHTFDKQHGLLSITSILQSERVEHTDNCSTKKSDNVIWMMYENFSSLSLST